MLEKRKRAFKILSAVFYIFCFCLLLAFLGHLGFMNLGAQHLIDYDESRHGVNAYEMRQTGDLLVTTYQYQPDTWNAKPPLSTWIIALNFKLFGASAFSLRLYSVLSMIACTVIVSIYALKRFGRLESLFVLLLTAAIPADRMLATHFFRYGDADMLYMLFFTIAMLFMLESRKSIRMYYGSAAFFALAFFTKSLHALVIPAICFVNALITGDIKRLRLKNHLMFVLIGLAPIGVWVAMRALRDGGIEFFATMLRNDLGRAVTLIEHHRGSIFYYVFYMEALFPITIGCTGVLALNALRGKSKPGRTTVGALAWFFIPLTLYSISKSKTPWYIYPVTFAMILSASVFYGRIARRAPKNLFASIIVIMIGLFCADMIYDTGCEIYPYTYEETPREQTLDKLVEAGVDQSAPLYIDDESTFINELGKHAITQDDVLQMYFDGWEHPVNGGAEAFLNCDTDGALLLIDRACAEKYALPEDQYSCLAVDDDYLLYTRKRAE